MIEGNTKVFREKSTARVIFVVVLIDSENLSQYFSDYFSHFILLMSPGQTVKKR